MSKNPAWTLEPAGCIYFVQNNLYFLSPHIIRRHLGYLVLEIEWMEWALTVFSEVLCNIIKKEQLYDKLYFFYVNFKNSMSFLPCISGSAAVKPYFPSVDRMNIDDSCDRGRDVLRAHIDNANQSNPHIPWSTQKRIVWLITVKKKKSNICHYCVMRSEC